MAGRQVARKGNAIDRTWASVFVNFGDACDVLCQYRMELLNHPPFVALLSPQQLSDCLHSPHHYRGMSDLLGSLMPPSPAVKVVMRTFCQQYAPLRALLGESLCFLHPAPLSLIRFA